MLPCVAPRNRGKLCDKAILLTRCYGLVNIKVVTNADEIKTSANSTYKKLAVQWLNEVLCFVSSSMVADSFRLRNRQLLVAANR